MNFLLARENAFFISAITKGHARTLKGGFPATDTPLPSVFVEAGFQTIPCGMVVRLKEHGEDMLPALMRSMIGYMYPGMDRPFRHALAGTLYDPEVLFIVYGQQQCRLFHWEGSHIPFTEQWLASFGMFCQVLNLDQATILLYDHFGELARRIACSTQIRSDESVPPPVDHFAAVRAQLPVPRYMQHAPGRSIIPPTALTAFGALARWTALPSAAFVGDAPPWVPPTPHLQLVKGVGHVGVEALHEPYGAAPSSGAAIAVAPMSLPLSSGAADEVAVRTRTPHTPRSRPSPVLDPRPLPSSLDAYPSSASRAPSRISSTTPGPSGKVLRAGSARRSAPELSRRQTPTALSSDPKGRGTAKANARGSSPRIAWDSSPGLSSTKRVMPTTTPFKSNTRLSGSTSMKAGVASSSPIPRQSFPKEDRPPLPKDSQSPGLVGYSLDGIRKATPPKHKVSVPKLSRAPKPDAYGMYPLRILKNIEKQPTLQLLPVTEAPLPFHPPAGPVPLRRAKVNYGPLSGNTLGKPVKLRIDRETGLPLKRSSTATPLGDAKRARVSTGGAAASSASAADADESYTGSGDEGDPNAGPPGRVRVRASWTGRAATSSFANQGAGGSAGPSTVPRALRPRASAKGKERASDDEVDYLSTDSEPIPADKSLFSP